VNVDYALGARLGRFRLLRRPLRAAGTFRIDWDPSIAIHDLRRRFPWSDGSADAIYSSHLLEHFTRAQGAHFLAECRRVLRPGGILRISVPSLTAVLDAYEKGVFPAVELIERLGVGTDHPDDGRVRRWLAPFVRFPHRCMYDAKSLIEALAAAGFEARINPPMVSRLPDIGDVEVDDRVRGGLIAEACRN